MSYDIRAWLEDGPPRLQIIDADSGAVRLAWQSRRPDPDAPDARHNLEQMALKSLFQELFLLSSLTGTRTGRRKRTPGGDGS